MSPSSQTGERRRGRPAEPLDQRILRLTDRSSDCWLWTGRLDNQGYGRITVKQRPMRAHRASYETFVGPVPTGLELDHVCRVRNCVNPDHLEPVTHRENVLRGASASGLIAGRRVGGQQLGESCPAGHVLTEENTYLRRGILGCLTCRREQNRLHASGGKPRQRTYTDHVKIAARLRGEPNIWSLAVTCSTAATASHVAYYMRSGKRLASYRPAGSFEAEFRTVDGEFQVYARYIGAVKS